MIFSSIVIKKSCLSTLISLYLAADQLLQVDLLLGLDGNGVGLVGQKLLAGVHSHSDPHEFVGLHGLADLLVLVLIFYLVHPFFGKRFAEIVMLAWQVDELILG